MRFNSQPAPAKILSIVLLINFATGDRQGLPRCFIKADNQVLTQQLSKFRQFYFGVENGCKPAGYCKVEWSTL